MDVRLFGKIALFLAALTTSSAVLAQAPSTVTGQAGEPSNRELLDELKALRARVDQLEQRPPSQAEIDATKGKIAADVASKSNVWIRYDKDGLFFGNTEE